MADIVRIVDDARPASGVISDARTNFATACASAAGLTGFAR